MIRGKQRGKLSNHASSQKVLTTMTHRTQRRSSSMLLSLLVIASCLFQDAAGTSTRVVRQGNDFILDAAAQQRRWRWRRRLEEEETTVDCQAVGVCEMCTDAQRSVDGNECEKTGRHQQYKCTTSKGEEEKSSSSYKSCDRTEADEEFLMIQLQAFCFTIGVFSLFSVRRNKQVGASLFDQRKAAAAQQQQQPHSLSLTSNGEQEMVPLTTASSDPLDVV